MSHAIAFSAQGLAGRIGQNRGRSPGVGMQNPGGGASLPRGLEVAVDVCELGGEPDALGQGFDERAAVVAGEGSAVRAWRPPAKLTGQFDKRPREPYNRVCGRQF